MRALVAFFQNRVYLAEHPLDLVLELARRAAQHARAQRREPYQVIARHNAHRVVLSYLVGQALDIRVPRLAVLREGDVYVVVILARTGVPGVRKPSNTSTSFAFVKPQ